MENKQHICDLLTAAIRETRAGDDLSHLEYDEDVELVNVYFGTNTFPSKNINVAADSGIAMIRDIVNKLDIG